MLSSGAAMNEYGRRPLGQIDEYARECGGFVGLHAQPAFAAAGRGGISSTRLCNPMFEASGEVGSSEDARTGWHGSAGLVHRATVRFVRS
jgi:hypothetical protein